jgi:uncharacterized membrane protein
VTTLVAVAFPDESTASATAEDVRWVALDVTTAADAVAVVSRDRAGVFHLTTSHGAPDGTRWGVFWVLLIETLFQDGMPDQPAPRAHHPSPRRRDAALDDPFRRHLGDMLAPGTSVLFLAVEDLISDEAVRELTRLGGVLVTWGLTVDAGRVVQAALRGMSASGAGGRLWPADGGTSARDGAYRAPGSLVRPGEACGSV